MRANNITLEKNYIAHSGEKAIDLTHSIEIDGKGHTINGNGMTGIFQADSSNINVVLKNIVFTNGKKSGDGGAIMVKSAKNVNIKIINCEFKNNIVSEDGAAIYYDSTGTLEITKSNFYKNTAEYSRVHNSNGGAINIQGGTLIIDDSKFLENTAEGGLGGAIYIKNSNNAQNYIKNSLFTKNKAKEGSAIYTNSKDGGLTVIESRFLNNHAQGRFMVSGTGTISTYNGYLIILNSGFSDNEAAGKGGAIYAESKLTIDGSFFNRNYVPAHDPGGAIYYNIAEDLKITNSQFQENKAGYDGGAIYINKKSNTLIENCEFTYNRISFYEKGITGGAIHNDGSGTITLKYSQFNYNVADAVQSEGGAVYTGSDMVIDGCVFIGNSAYGAGGAVYCGGEITWTNSSIFKNNHVSTSKTGSIATKGGAVYASTFKNSAYGLIFENNQAQYGGAIYK